MPNSASTRAMSPGLLAIFTKRIAALLRQRGQVMMSTANTRCLAITLSSVAAPPSDASWSA